MFIDETTIKARAGDGGRGCVSFRREKYEPWGGPNGGDGGKGGDVVLRGDDDQNNLIDFKYKPHWNGERGEHGLGSDCTGREGRPAVLRVPLGTIAYRLDTGEQVAEVLEDGQEIVLLKGGKGGFGNTKFKSSTNRAPRKTGPGEPGEVGEFRLELKSIADVGLVGLPFGKRPFRLHYDPTGDGADVGFTVLDRLRAEMLHRVGLSDLLHPARPA